MIVLKPKVSMRVNENSHGNSSITKNGYITAKTSKKTLKIPATFLINISVALTIAVTLLVFFSLSGPYSAALVTPPTPARSKVTQDKN